MAYGYTNDEKRTAADGKKAFDYFVHAVYGRPLPGPEQGGWMDAGLPKDRSNEREFSSTGDTTQEQGYTASTSQELIPPNPRVIEIRIVTASGAKWQRFRVYQDTASEDNWISPEMARLLNLDVCRRRQTALIRSKDISVVGFDGGEYQSDETAVLTWRGKRTSDAKRGEEMEVFVGPEDFPVGMLVGRPFLNSKNPYEFDQFWSEEEKRNPLVLVAKELKKKEKEKMEADVVKNKPIQDDLVLKSKADRQKTRDRAKASRSEEPSYSQRVEK